MKAASALEPAASRDAAPSTTFHMKRIIVHKNADAPIHQTVRNIFDRTVVRTIDWEKVDAPGSPGGHEAPTNPGSCEEDAHAPPLEPTFNPFQAPGLLDEVSLNMEQVSVPGNAGAAGHAGGGMDVVQPCQQLDASQVADLIAAARTACLNVIDCLLY